MRPPAWMRRRPPERGIWRNLYEKLYLHLPELPHQLLAVLPRAAEQRHERAGHRRPALRRADARAEGEPERILQGGQSGELRRSLPRRGFLRLQVRQDRLAGVQQRILAGAGRPPADRLQHHHRLPSGGHPPHQVQEQDEGLLPEGRHHHRPLPHGGQLRRLPQVHRRGGLPRGGQAGQRRGRLGHLQAVHRPGAAGLPGLQIGGASLCPLHHGGVRPRRGEQLRRHHRRPRQPHL